jgi:hypothetical protein
MRAKVFGLVLVALLSAVPSLSAGNLPAIAEREIIAQIHVLRATTLAELEKEILSIKSAGFTAIAVRVFQNYDDRFHGLTRQTKDFPFTGVYFKSSVAPTVIDLLTPLLELTQKHQLSLYAWMTSRTMDWLDMKNARDWVLTPEHPKGYSEATHFDLFNDEFLSLQFRLFADLAKSGVDGILVQDDLVIKTREGMTDTALSKYMATLDFPISLADLRNQLTITSKLFADWSVYKRNRINLVIANLKKAIADKGNPQLLINVYPDTVLNSENGLKWLGQDLESLNHSKADRIMFMAYYSQLSHELGIPRHEAIDIVKPLISKMQQNFGQRLVVKFQIVDWSNREAIPSFEFGNFAESGYDFSLTPVETSEKELEHATRILREITLERAHD